jgi:hypothetical protein
MLFDNESRNLTVRSISLGLWGEGLISSYTELGVSGSSMRNHQWRLLTYRDRYRVLRSMRIERAVGEVMVVP